MWSLFDARDCFVFALAPFLLPRDEFEPNAMMLPPK
jgi:hypothetical protein